MCDAHAAKSFFLQHALECLHIAFHLGIRFFGAARGIGALHLFVSSEHCLTFIQAALFQCLSSDCEITFRVFLLVTVALTAASEEL